MVEVGMLLRGAVVCHNVEAMNLAVEIMSNPRISPLLKDKNLYPLTDQHIQDGVRNFNEFLTYAGKDNACKLLLPQP
jgi:hypothetical protein